jgi:threonine dehydrogenase-like Zn-dependent dehydrogenase
MKAASVAGKGQIQIEEIAKPEVRPGTLLMKVIYCSICGSDVERVYGPLWDIASEEQLATLKGSILGHEYVARVEVVGEGVTGWSVGDRAVDVHIPCGNCYYCRRGLSHMCMHGRVRGHPYDGTPSPFPGPPRWGAMTEYILRPASSRLRVPDSVSDEEAAMCEPLATGVTATLCAEVKLADSAVVIGVGHIGLMVLSAAKAAGAAPLIAIDKNSSRLDVASQMGADIILNPDDTDVIKALVDITQAGPDIAFVCVSSFAAGVLEQAFEMVRYGGRVIIVGNAAPASLSPTNWLTKEVRVEGTVHMGEAMVPALKLLEYGKVNIKPAITEIIPLKEAQRAFDSLHNAENIAVLLKP